MLGYVSTNAEKLRHFASGFSDAGANRVIVARVSGAIVGFATTHLTPFLHRPPAGRLTALAVLPDFQGRGIGRALLRRCEEILSAAGVDRIELTSGSQRREAHDFYRRAGYEETGVRFVKTL
ncbi:MAG: GNAT family N-acetyltransferase [Thermoanaerobaculia bacterium]